GSMHADSTAGGIAGALVTACYLIRAIGVRHILLSFGITLIALALFLIGIGQLARRRAEKPLSIGSVLVPLLFGVHAIASAGPLYEADSLYHHIIVTEDGGVRYLRFDRLRQSALDLNDPHRMVFQYTQYRHLP